MRASLFILVIISLATAVGCQHGGDPEASRTEILDLHQGFIQAHLDKDVETLVAPLAQDYLLVRDGEVLTMTPDQVREGLAEYLARTRFLAYEDVSEPIVGLSRDGSTAWSIVQVRVAGSPQEPEAGGKAFDTTWAWVTLYERRGDGWTVIADVSTYRPTRDAS